ncbi:MAG TPA: TRAP transporter small permease subunit [Azospirillaceae bacterium]|nr:TRAP transporter small permease subunit [Azospirillaceae bacterium]
MGAIDALNIWMGRLSAFLVIALVVICSTNAVMRYVFSIGYVWMQEAYVAAFGVSFMLMAGYAYLTDQHVRVDIYHARYSPKTRAWVEILGILVFLWPWLYVVARYSQGFILDAWRLREGSSQAGGMPGIFLVKTGIWAFCALVALQSLATMARAITVITGRPDLLPVRETVEGATKMAN